MEPSGTAAREGGPAQGAGMWGPSPASLVSDRAPRADGSGNTEKALPYVVKASPRETWLQARPPQQAGATAGLLGQAGPLGWAHISCICWAAGRVSAVGPLHPLTIFCFEQTDILAAINHRN